MTFLTKEKTKLTFEDRLNKKAPGTREVYKVAFRNFEKFCEDHYNRTMEEVISELDVVDEGTVCETMQDWIEGKSPEERPTLHNFFSRSAWDEQLQRSFKNHVEVNKPELQNIINKFKN